MGLLVFPRDQLALMMERLSPEQLRFALALLLRARWSSKPSQWDGIEIGRGELVISVARLAGDLKMDRKVARTAIRKLTELGLIRAYGRANRYTIVTWLNYPTYGDPKALSGQPAGHLRANRGPTAGHVIEREKERKGKRTPLSQKNLIPITEARSRFSGAHEPTANEKRENMRELVSTLRSRFPARRESFRPTGESITSQEPEPLEPTDETSESSLDNSAKVVP